MESILVIAGLILAVIFALGELAREKLKTKQLEELKAHAVKAEIRAQEQDNIQLDGADIATTVDFLNRVHKTEHPR